MARFISIYRPPRTSLCLKIRNHGLLAALLLLLTAASIGHAGQDAHPAPPAPGGTSADPVAKLWRKIVQGKASLDISSDKAYLASLLKALDIPIASQVLVFSKTSLQNALIGPSRPRAIYFNEECYLGTVQGGAIELIGMDPVNGPQYYTLEYPQSAKALPVIVQSEQCLSCHESSRTGGVKGMLVRSVFPDAQGNPLLEYGSFVSTTDSPLSERWGGWYVTGKHGHDLHMGNVIAEPQGAQVSLPRQQGANLTSLDCLISTEPYLTKSSDIVALMVLEHQCATQNTLTAAGKTMREAMERQHSLQEAFKEPRTDVPQGSALSILLDQTEKVVRKLLFSGEYELQDGGIEGDPGFQSAFQRNRHDDREGRSFKDFQLNSRLFKNRCSYMIYSESFAALPPVLKKQIHLRLREVLASFDPTRDKDYIHLSASEREHILQILEDTLPQP